VAQALVVLILAQMVTIPQSAVLSYLLGAAGLVERLEHQAVLVVVVRVTIVQAALVRQGRVMTEALQQTLKANIRQAVVVALALLVLLVELSTGLVEMVVAAQVQVLRVHLSLMLVAAVVVALKLVALAALAVEVQDLITPMVRLALPTQAAVVEVLPISHLVLADREL
jgi:hypothetical protein